MIAIIVCIGFPLMAFLNQIPNPKSLWSLALTVLHNSPTTTTTTTMTMEGDQDQQLEYSCAVCLAQVCCGDKYRILSQCKHGFHVECIDGWLKDHSTCPLCRTQVLRSSSP